MNETLKGVAHIGAELAAAKADLQLEMERHRKTWRQLEQVQRERIDPFSVAEAIRKALDRNSCPNVFLVIAYEAAIEALSLQAEPAQEPREKSARPGYLDQAVIDRVAEISARHLEEISRRLAEPSPAQDELRKRFDEIEDEVARGKHTAASVFTQMRTAAMYIRPAQTEQQPEQSGLAEALERVKLTEEEAQHHSVSAVAYWNNAVTACIAALSHD